MVQVTNYELVTDIESSQVPVVAPVEVGTPVSSNDAINQAYLGGIGAGLKNKLDGTTAPTVNDDSGDGYAVGSMWIDTTNSRMYHLFDSTTGAAIWIEIILPSAAQTLLNKVLSDSTTSIAANADLTKKLQFSITNIATSTTRTLTMLNMNGTFVFIGTKVAILAHARFNGALWWATDEKKLYGDDGVSLISIGSGGGGIAIGWNNEGEFALFEVTRYNQKYYEFNKNVDQKLHGSFKVPSTYAAGSAISIKGKIHTDTAGGDLLLTIKSTLIRQGVDLISSVTNQRISTNTAESVPALDQDIIVDWDIVSSIGEVNSVALSANDRIDLEVYRGSDSNTGNLYFSTSSLEVVL